MSSAKNLGENAHDSLLFPQHLAMLRTESGITDAVIAERGYRSIDAAEGYALLKELGFTQRQRYRNWPGLYIPRFTPAGTVAVGQYRPDNPRTDTKGKPIKYETPQRGWVGLDVPPRCTTMLQDSETLLWVTEGTKKADAIASHGGCAIALAGVWNFRATKYILDEWDTIPLQNRSINIVYDSDVMTKGQVQKALKELTLFLQRRGAWVSWCYLPQGISGHKIGVDDYLVAGHTLDELESLAKDTETPTPGFSLSQNARTLANYLQKIKPSIARLLEPDAIQELAELFGKRTHWAVIEQYMRDARFAPENIRVLRQSVAEHIENKKARIIDLVEYADHLQHNKPEPIQYQHDKILPVTGVTVLAGRPKLGKSYLMLNLAIAVATGGPFISNFPMAYPGAVLYLALEDNRQRIYARMHALFGPQGIWPKHLGFVYTSPRMDDGRLCRELEQWIMAVDAPRLIIIDIFARVKPRQTPNSDIYQADYDAITELCNLGMAYGVNVAIVTHLNKNYSDVEEVADAIMGSTGITGGTSTIWAMSHVGENGVDAALHVTGKDVPTWTIALQEIALDGHKDWKALGDIDLVGQGDARLEVLQAIYAWEGFNPTIPELQEELRKKRQPFKRLIDRMRLDGLIRLEKRRLFLTTLGASTREVETRLEEENPRKHGAEGASGASGAEGAEGAFQQQIPDMNRDIQNESDALFAPFAPFAPSPSRASPKTRARELCTACENLVPLSEMVNGVCHHCHEQGA